MTRFGSLGSGEPAKTGVRTASRLCLSSGTPHLYRTIGAIAVYLTQHQLLPLARACEVMSDLLGVQMSEGTVGELIKRCAGQLAPVEHQIKEMLQEAEVIHQDETGLSVAGKRHWMHV